MAKSRQTSSEMLNLVVYPEKMACMEMPFEVCLYYYLLMGLKKVSEFGEDEMTGLFRLSDD